MLTFSAFIETLPLHSPFGIARDIKQAVDVVVVEVSDAAGHVGKGECRPYARYEETPESVVKQLLELKMRVEATQASAVWALKEQVQTLLPAGAARNAIDCALWDLISQQEKRSVAALIGAREPVPALPMIQTLSLDTPEKMAAAAVHAAMNKTLKIKLGGHLNEDEARLQAIHAARPDAALIVDANEGWSIETLQAFLPLAAPLGVTMIEQPLPASKDAALMGMQTHGIVLCGDESIHTAQDMLEKAELYGMMNVKLDKAGGLTHALEMVQTLAMLNARRVPEKQIQLMVGCMVSSSLALAPAMLLAQHAVLSDMDGAWWLQHDRPYGLRFEKGWVHQGSLWGMPASHRI